VSLVTVLAAWHEALLGLIMMVGGQLVGVWVCAGQPSATWGCALQLWKLSILAGHES
jgi:hypothetical protein